jgi:hypothetical protein
VTRYFTKDGDDVDDDGEDADEVKGGGRNDADRDDGVGGEDELDGGVGADEVNGGGNNGDDAGGGGEDVDAPVEVVDGSCPFQKALVCCMIAKNVVRTSFTGCSSHHKVANVLISSSRHSRGNAPCKA